MRIIKIIIVLFIAIFPYKSFAVVTPILYDINNAINGTSNLYLDSGTYKLNFTDLGFTDSSNTKVFSTIFGEFGDGENGVSCPDLGTIMANNGNTTVTWTSTAGFPVNNFETYAFLFDNCGDGNYYVILQDSGTSGNFYISYEISGGGTIFTPGSSEPINEETRIDTLTYSTSTRIANITGYWNTHASSTESLSFWQYSNALGQEDFISINATTTGAFNFDFDFSGVPTPYNTSTSTSPIIGNFTLNANIKQKFSDFNIFTGEGTPDILLASTSTLIESGTYDIGTITNLYEYPEYECSISSITGCFKNAGVWLFYPAPDSIENFKNLNQEIAGKFPFAYVYDMNEMRTELFNSAQTATTTISVDFKIIPGQGTSTLEFLSAEKLSNVPFSNWIKTILGYLLWFMFAEYLYFRILKIHDK